MFNKKKHNKAKNKPHYKKANTMMAGAEGDNDGNEKLNKGKGPLDGNFELNDNDVDFKEDIINEDVKEIKEIPNNKKENKKQESSGASKTECCICGLPIRSIHTSMVHNVTGGLAHFDCILKELINEKKSKLGRFKKVYYIGAGNFAIVKEIFDKKGRLKTYEILEKIEYTTNHYN